MYSHNFTFNLITFVVLLNRIPDKYLKKSSFFVFLRGNFRFSFGDEHKKKDFISLEVPFVSHPIVGVPLRMEQKQSVQKQWYLLKTNKVLLEIFAHWNVSRCKNKQDLANAFMVRCVYVRHVVYRKTYKFDVTYFVKVHLSTVYVYMFTCVCDSHSTRSRENWLFWSCVSPMLWFSVCFRCLSLCRSLRNLHFHNKSDFECTVFCNKRVETRTWAARINNNVCQSDNILAVDLFNCFFLLFLAADGNSIHLGHLLILNHHWEEKKL